MPSGFTVTGRGDLDSLFMARQGAKRADVAFYVAGSDISNRYEPIGTVPPIPAVNYFAAGVDLANLFRDINVPLITQTLVAATQQYSTPPQHTTGYLSHRLGFGSLTPNTVNGVAVYEMYDTGYASSPATATFNITIPGSLPQTFFTSIQVNGRTFTSASATWGLIGYLSVTQWYWPNTPAGFVAGNSYPMVIT